MSAASSFEESPLSNTEIAQETDRRLLFVAQNLPGKAFKGANGEAIVLCNELDIGELSCTNTGHYTMEIMVKLYKPNDRLGFWKEYGLSPEQLGRPRKNITLIDSTPSSPSEFEDCPDTATFIHGFNVLFAKFIAQLSTNTEQSESDERPSDNVIYLADHEAG